MTNIIKVPCIRQGKLSPGGEKSLCDILITMNVKILMSFKVLMENEKRTIKKEIDESSKSLFLKYVKNALENVDQTRTLH